MLIVDQLGPGPGGSGGGRAEGVCVGDKVLVPLGLLVRVLVRVAVGELLGVQG